MFTPGANGLTVTISQDRDAGIGVATLASFAGPSPFFLEGDFDLLVDYAIVGALPHDAHALLVLDNTPNDVNAHYDIARESAPGGADNYSSGLGGVPPVKLSTADTSGTLELMRTGSTIQSLAGGTQVTQLVSATKARLSILLTVAIGDMCNTSCTMSVRWSNLRLKSGTIVDRR
jgi:hypothetical protein